MQMVNQRWRHLCGPPAFLFRFEYPPLTVFPRAFADPFVDPSSSPPPPPRWKNNTAPPPRGADRFRQRRGKTDSAAAIDRWNFLGRSLTNFVFQ